MASLIQTVEQFIQDQVNIDLAMREMCDHGDSIALYENEIRDQLRGMYSALNQSSELLDSVIEYIYLNQEQFIIARQSGLPHVAKGIYCIDSINEYWFHEGLLPFELTEDRKQIINQYTDLVVTDSGLFLNAEYDYIALDLNKVGQLTFNDL